LSITSYQLSTHRRLIHHFISISERYTEIMGFPTCLHVINHMQVQLNKYSFSMCYIGESYGVSSQLFAQRRLAQRSSSISDRNHAPISWVHPTHGLSLKSNHSICVLENVSRSCNHQQSLSAREAFYTRPSLSQKYSKFILASGLVKISAICSWVGRYCMCTIFLCTMSLI
jgi:hypothetical protein